MKLLFDKYATTRVYWLKFLEDTEHLTFHVIILLQYFEMLTQSFLFIL